MVDSQAHSSIQEGFLVQLKNLVHLQLKNLVYLLGHQGRIVDISSCMAALK